MVEKISIIIPVYRGELTIKPLVEKLFAMLGERLHQVVLVNDFSPDNSDAVCRSLHASYSPRLTYVSLGRNFGEHNAVMAGLNHATGDYMVIMDDDFQNPPEEVTRLVNHAESTKSDVVYTYYKKKKHHPLRNLGSLLINQVATWLIGKPGNLYLSSFKCVNRWLCEEIKKYDGPYPYIDGLILSRTSRIGRIEVQHNAREVGRSSYTISKLLSLAIRVFVNFSVVPLRLSALIGVLLSLFGGCFGIYVVWEKVSHPEVQVGWPSLMTAILVFSGVQLIILGLLGEYLGRLYLTVNRMPQFSVREVLS
jgi:glycosyltransferase involved in cell wall biosynthesis